MSKDHSQQHCLSVRAVGWEKDPEPLSCPVPESKPLSQCPARGFLTQALAVGGLGSHCLSSRELAVNLAGAGLSTEMFALLWTTWLQWKVKSACPLLVLLRIAEVVSWGLGPRE